MFSLLLVLQSYKLLQAQISNQGIMVLAPDTQLSIADNMINTGSFINDGETFIYANFTNDKTVDYTPDNIGYTIFQGTHQQILSGTEPMYFYDVLVNNTNLNDNAIDIRSTINVENELYFSEGIINTISDPSARLIMLNNARATNANNFSFVNGFVEKEGNRSFTFPVGDDEFYRYAAISAPDNPNAIIKCRYVYLNDDISPYPITKRIGNLTDIDGSEYWILESVVGSQTLELTLSWDENTTTPLNTVLQPYEDICIARWDSINNAWIDAGGGVDAATQTVTTTVTINEPSIFTLARSKSGIVLPGGVIIWNALSLNNDGINDELIIEGIRKFPNNKLEIYNIWGAMVFETTNYNTYGNVFKGQTKSNPNKLLPSGTYFYTISYTISDSEGFQHVEKAGYMYLNTD